MIFKCSLSLFKETLFSGYFFQYWLFWKWNWIVVFLWLFCVMNMSSFQCCCHRARLCLFTLDHLQILRMVTPPFWQTKLLWSSLERKALLVRTVSVFQLEICVIEKPLEDFADAVEASTVHDFHQLPLDVCVGLL